jgi:hypothetical protein
VFDEVTVLRSAMAAYRELVKITKEKMTAEQVGHLLQAERHLTRALMHMGRNRLERFGIKQFVMKMMRRETGTDGP